MTEIILVRVLILLSNILLPVGMIFVVKVMKRNLNKRQQNEVEVTYNGKQEVLSPQQVIRRICIFFGICMIGVLALFVMVTVPFLRDCVYMLKNGTQEVSGIIEGDTHYGSSASQKEDVKIVADDGTEIELRLEASDKKEGDHVVVRYLPYSREGVIVE